MGVLQVCEIRPNFSFSLVASFLHKVSNPLRNRLFEELSKSALAGMKFPPWSRGSRQKGLQLGPKLLSLSCRPRPLTPIAIGPR